MLAPYIFLGPAIPPHFLSSKIATTNLRQHHSHQKKVIICARSMLFCSKLAFVM